MLGFTLSALMLLSLTFFGYDKNKPLIATNIIIAIILIGVGLWS